MNWYLKKDYFDSSDDIETVIIHYVCTPFGQEPDWSRAESRSMPAGEYLKTGVGEVAKYGPAQPRVPQTVHPRLRKKILKMPNEVYDPALAVYTDNYLLHYCFEVVRDGDRQFSPVVTEEIATREVGLLDPAGIIGGVCANWSVADWDAPQFSPTEETQFVARFGEDHPLRQFKFYGTTDREAFGVAKKAVVDTLPLPHRFTIRISAPVDATVCLRFHVGNWGLAEYQRWEDYWLDESFVMERDAEPFIAMPLGTQAAPAPLTTVAPELLIDNPYLPLIPGYQPVESAVVREAEAIVEAVEGVNERLTAELSAVS